MNSVKIILLSLTSIIRYKVCSLCSTIKLFRIKFVNILDVIKLKKKIKLFRDFVIKCLN